MDEKELERLKIEMAHAEKLLRQLRRLLHRLEREMSKRQPGSVN
jgi:hypothetical protein